MKTLFFLFSLSLSFSTVAQVNYLAKFKTLNPQISGILSGSATIYMNDKDVKAFVRLFAGSPNTGHMQNVFIGDRCPGLQDDLNFDGFIDIKEALKAVGSIIIPLDGDISSQKAEGDIFPLADASGSYSYDKEAKLKKFMKDLRAEDKNPNDNIVKLYPYEELNLEGKVVLIQGVADGTVLPKTVATSGSRKSVQTLPIACGVFKRTL